MESPKIVTSPSQNIQKYIVDNWDNLEERQKSIILKFWKVITYKWQLQILLNVPFLIWWFLDKSIVEIHNFDLKLISYLNLPNWVLSFIGFSQSGG